MGTSSSPRESPKGFVLVQTGVVAWEGPIAYANWRCKTISVIARTLGTLSQALKTSLSDVSSAVRVHVVTLPIDIAPTQRARIMKSLAADPPGMKNTVASISEGDVALVQSEIVDVDEVDLGYLSSYRSSLVIVRPGGPDPGDISAAVSGSAFDGEALGRILEVSAGAALLRVLDMETHAVLQVIGEGTLLGAVLKRIEKQGFRRLLQPSDVPGAISQLS
jgi:hypothetical protein